MDLKVKLLHEGTIISPEKRLRGHLLTLSQSLLPCQVETMTRYLLHTRTITDYEAGVIKSQPTGMQKASHLIQIVSRKGRDACLVFFQCLGECNPVLFEKLAGSPAIPSNTTGEQPVDMASNTVDKQPSKNHTFTGDSKGKSTSQFCSTPERNFTPHAPAYIINIYNSTLKDCIIGNQSSQIISTEQESLLPERQDLSLQENARTSLMSDHRGASEIAEGSHNIQVQDSHMKYVIIGNQSSMVVNTTQTEEDVEWEDNEEYQRSSEYS